MVAAILIQNLSHPKNSQRREAITSKTYSQLATPEEADHYLHNLLLQNLKLEIQGRETQIKVSFAQAASSQSASIFLDAPDKYYAAAVLLQEGFFVGKGDRTRIIHMIKKAGGFCKAIKEKLQLLQMSTYQGQKLFKDACKGSPNNLNINKHMQYKLWIELVRQKGVLSNEDYIEIFPNSKEKAEIWYDCVDEEGKPYLDFKKYE